MYGYIARIATGAIIAIANLSIASASPSAASMQEGGYALAPFSFVKFCLDYPSDCPKSAGPRRVRLTSGRMAELSSVNRAVNASIRPRPDTSTLRYWRLDVDAGDCNSFAVQKRHELIRRGWPAAALALTVAKTARGEGHLVVTVRTNQGDLVLDNLKSNIVPWQKAGYQWIMRQSEGNPQFWVELNGGQAGPVGAAQDLDDATEIAEADGAAGAGSTPADAAQAEGARRVDAEAPAAAVDEARAPAAPASIAGLTRRIEGNRQAAAPLLDSVVAALDRLIETTPAAPAKPLEENERVAMAADAVDVARLGFV
jgi:predicted transglutaminase-like cysteine proteinase